YKPLRSSRFIYPLKMLVEGRQHEYLHLNGKRLVHQSLHFYRDLHGDPCGKKTAVRAVKKSQRVEEQLRWEMQGNEGPAPRWKPVQGSGIPDVD
ncbi:MAG: hypothetical protein ACREJF_09515, partial [Candidatus Methylomirabilales bacterium]